MKKALFVTFEGVEGSGKSSQIARVYEHFTTLKYKVLRTREPGGTTLAEKIRQILIHHEYEALSLRSELLLLLAARAQHVDQLIQKHRHDHDLILCDRFIDSTLAYQGGGRGMDLNWLRELNLYATGGLLPDLTFLMDLSVERSQARVEVRKKRTQTEAVHDRFESEELEFHERVRKTYLQIAQNESDRFVVLDATEKPLATRRNIIDQIQKRLTS